MPARRTAPCRSTQYGSSLIDDGASVSDDYNDPIIQSILKEDENEDEALVEYGKALVEVDKRTDALHVFLRVLVHKPDHAETRQQIAHILSGEGGVEMVRSI